MQTKTTFIVMRNCCTSGNCFDCTKKAPFGTPVQIEHARYTDAKRAKAVADGWRAYKAHVVRVAAR